MSIEEKSWECLHVKNTNNICLWRIWFGKVVVGVGVGGGLGRGQQLSFFALQTLYFIFVMKMHFIMRF